MYVIGFLVKGNGLVATVRDAESLVLIDLDNGSEKKIVLSGAPSLYRLAQLIEDNDVAVLFVSSIVDEERLFLEEPGVKIYVVGNRDVGTVLSEVVG